MKIVNQKQTKAKKKKNDKREMQKNVKQSVRYSTKQLPKQATTLDALPLSSDGLASNGTTSEQVVFV